MVPEGWTLTPIGKHIDLLSGFPFKSSGYINAGGIRLLRGDNIEPGNLRWKNAKRWPESDCEELEKYQLKEGDFVIAMDRTWISSGLKVAEVTHEDIPCLLVQRVSRIRALPSIEQSLLRQYFSGSRFEQYVKSVQKETAVPHISAAQIKDFSVLLPPKKEQQRIAKILSTWDKAIATTGQLLANSEQRKIALMQQLLTGKMRLPGFEGEWQNLRLGEIGDVSSAGVDKKSNTKEQKVRLLNYLDVFRREFIFDQELSHQVTAPEKKIVSCSVKKGDVFFTPSSETRDELAFSAVACETMPGVVYSYHVVRLRPKVRLDLNFSAYLFQTPQFRRQAYRAGDGSGQRYVISQKSFRKMEVSLPPIAEQEAIGRVLRAASDYSNALRKEVYFLKEEKKALMQQLLTGKRRVKIDEAERATT